MPVKNINTVIKTHADFATNQLAKLYMTHNECIRVSISDVTIRPTFHNIVVHTNVFLLSVKMRSCDRTHFILTYTSSETSSEPSQYRKMFG
jgi:hypothetical protein